MPACLFFPVKLERKHMHREGSPEWGEDEQEMLIAV